jgi:two-component system response regulator LytT
MQILIIEDELKTAKSLSRLISRIKPEAVLPNIIQSVATAVKYLTAHPAPDLIFMDIQLADGLCFDIFKQVKVVSPVVFCTAFNDYALEGFKSNGIDYLLKPFSEESIRGALEKVEGFKNFFQQHADAADNLDQVLNPTLSNEGKSSFLVFKQNKYVIVPTEQIAFFYIKNDAPTIMTFEQKEFVLSQSLDEVHQQLSALQFFRINRQYLINFKAIDAVEPYFARKLFVKLLIPSPDQLLVGKDKATAFLTWLEHR